MLLYTQHLLGIGHLTRAVTLARGLVAGGFEVCLASGGFPVPEITLPTVTFRQLPPTRATDRHFKQLVDENGQPINELWRADRRGMLLDLVEEQSPDIVITELFPFGRRQMRFELIPMLNALQSVRPIPLVVCSVRDILVASPKPKRVDEMLNIAQSFYDLILVHGDPNLISFAQTFPQATALGHRLHHTGYIVEQSEDLGDIVRGGDVLISVGGGAVGVQLVETALAARSISRLKERRWRFLLGSAMSETDFSRFAKYTTNQVVIERARPDFRRLLREAALSISQGGYNTVMEVLDACTPGIVIPYAGGLETEQTLRACLLMQRGLLTVVGEAELTPQRLARAIDLTEGINVPVRTLDMNGLSQTAELLYTAIKRRQRGTSSTDSASI